MEMRVDTLQDGITRISLAGRMDFAGSTEIDAGFMASASGTKFLLVDLSKVTFLASMGIRTLITGDRSLKERGGKMVLFSPEMAVAKVLKTSGTDILIPVHYELSSAYNALQPSAPAR